MVIDPTFKAAAIRFARIIITAALAAFVLAIYSSITSDPNANLAHTFGQAFTIGLTAAINAGMEWLRAYLVANNIVVPVTPVTATATGKPTIASLTADLKAQRAFIAPRPDKVWADYLPI
jgi:hypothetical protein